MKYSQLINIKVLPHNVTESLYNDVRKEFHLDYKKEVNLFNCIKQGDLNRLFKELTLFTGNDIVVGRMSENELRQFRYMAVSTITLATRYAIEGGLNEEDAYSFSDSFIMKIDSLKSADEILDCIAGSVIKLTNSVCEESKKLKYSPYIRKCVSYINKNLNKKITVSRLAEECGISADYLSHLFKTEMGETLTSFIINKKLEAAKALLLDGFDSKRIYSALGFSSQSYFISVFKKKYSVTPKEFITFAK